MALALNRLALAPLAVCCLAWPGCAEKKVDKFQPLEDVPFEIVDWNYGQAKGRKVISEHYEIHTTVGDERLLRALPQVMESAFRHYQRLAPFSTPPAERLPVYLFASRPEFDHFTRRFAGQQSDVLVQIRSGGYSMEGITVAQYVSHAITFPIMTHEGFHQYLHVCVNRRVPAWLNEGLAVLCEGQRWDERGLRQFDPWFNPLRRNRLAQAVQRRQTFPLRELLRINAGHVIDKPGVWVDAYYGQVWALLLFLQNGENGKYADGLKRLLESLNRPDVEEFARAAHVTSGSQDYNYGEALFCAFITTDIDAFAAEYERFIDQTLILGRR
jgi:hypothetical protein